jgi:ketosteroid isomerase-like protein
MASDALRLASAFCLILILSGCESGLDDEARIERNIAAMTEALEQGDVSDFMALVAEDFVAVNGRLDRRALGLLVRRERMARDAISIQRLDTRVEIFLRDDGNARARASFRALATGGTGLLPDEGRFWKVETGWRRDAGEWVLISAEWE